MRLDEQGSAVSEFVMVSILVIILLLGLVQLAIALHVRNMLISSASAGASVASRYDAGLADGERRTSALIAQSLGDYPAEVTASLENRAGTQVVVVGVSAPLPVFGLWGPGTIEVTGHAVKEVDRGDL